MINPGPERTLIQCFGGTKGSANLFCIVPLRTCLTETIIHKTRNHPFDEKNPTFVKHTSTENTWSKQTVRWTFFHKTEKKTFFGITSRANDATSQHAHGSFARIEGCKDKLEKLEGSFPRLKSSFIRAKSCSTAFETERGTEGMLFKSNDEHLLIVCTERERKARENFCLFGSGRRNSSLKMHSLKGKVKGINIE